MGLFDRMFHFVLTDGFHNISLLLLLIIYVGISGLSIPLYLSVLSDFLYVANLSGCDAISLQFNLNKC